jgi:hypothetical protein
VWSLDHIVPVDLFNFDDLKLCYNFINIMPMFINDNINKGASVHFSIEKLRVLLNNLKKTETELNSSSVGMCNTLIEKCNEEIIRTYNKYLI